MGAFAVEAAQPGRWVGRYQGPLISLDEQRDLYYETDPEYLFQITPDLYIDGNLSEHFTRFFNHDQRGNLNFTVSVDERRVDFFAASAIAPGSELCFDYGVGYWLGSAASPANGSDSRNFSLAAAAPPLPGPPPLTPRTADELQAVLRLPPAETKLALVRLMHAAPPPLLPAQLLLQLHLLDLEDEALLADVSPEKPVRLLTQLTL